MDTSRFKPRVTPRKAIDLLIYLTDGYVHSLLMAGQPLDVPELYRQYHIWQEMVRDFVYKTEEP